jgi:hypothetical protein
MSLVLNIKYKYKSGIMGTARVVKTIYTSYKYIVITYVPKHS